MFVKNTQYITLGNKPQDCLPLTTHFFSPSNCSGAKILVCAQLLRMHFFFFLPLFFWCVQVYQSMCKVVLVSRCTCAAELLVSPRLFADTLDIRFSYDLYTIDIIAVIYAN